MNSLPDWPLPDEENRGDEGAPAPSPSGCGDPHNYGREAQSAAPQVPQLAAPQVPQTPSPLETTDEGAPGPSHLGTGDLTDAGREAQPAAPQVPQVLLQDYGVSAPRATADSYFERYAQPAPPSTRFPNIADVGIMLLLLSLSWLLSGMLVLGALQIHLFGVASLQQAAKDVRYNLGGQAVLYVVALAAWVLVFRAVWHVAYLRGLEWRVSAAIHARWRIATALVACLLLALADSILLPGPAHAPIEDAFRQPGAAWLLFAFGITLAPLVEEMIFRGFLLPALCTAWDWTTERIMHQPSRGLDADGKPNWSPPAMVAGSLLTSVPFALIHAPQTAWSFGPFALLVCVSLALCWIRLSTRSLAASTAVHACYNFSLFLFMYIGTGGFKHLDKI